MGCLDVNNKQTNEHNNITIFADCSLNTSWCLKWCIGKQPFEVNFGYLYHMTAIKVNGIDEHDNFLTHSSKLPFNMLFSKNQLWTNADKVKLYFSL